MALPIKKITVVCTGNSCRSPMAERLLAHALSGQEPPLNEIEVNSAGVSAFSGDTASANSIAALKQVGLDLSDHRSTRFNHHLAMEADLILVMTKGHKSIIEQSLPEVKDKLFLFQEFENGEPNDIPDPFGGNIKQYVETRDSLVSTIPSIINFIKQNNS